MACAGESLGSSLGLAVVMDTTAQRSENWTSACGDSSSPDAIYEWTAPADGTFSFDTSGSYYDTVVAVLAGCDGPEIACSDDAGEHLWSSVDVELTAGEKVLIVVDGWAEGDSGEFQLNIWQL